ncbi:hypothetical protein JCM19233_6289 [Vibrio astriarenae]|nr:hypothetical protein JCM19233_6289 [Vibrio sp. C7]
MAKSLEHEEPEQDKEENSTPDPVAEPSNIAALERVADSITYPFSHIHSVIENKQNRSKSLRCCRCPTDSIKGVDS